jgi:hypothetical protein
MDRPHVVSRDEWLASHKELLAQEKPLRLAGQSRPGGHEESRLSLIRPD